MLFLQKAGLQHYAAAVNLAVHLLRILGKADALYLGTALDQTPQPHLQSQTHESIQDTHKGNRQNKCIRCHTWDTLEFRSLYICFYLLF